MFTLNLSLHHTTTQIEDNYLDFALSPKSYNAKKRPDTFRSPPRETELQHGSLQ